jgi:hypothetical protein
MRSFAALLLLSAWTGIDYYPGYNFFPVDSQPGEVCSFTFPDAALHAHYPAFLVQTNASSLSMSNRTVALTFSLDCSSNAVFRYGGQDFWNIGGLPANARLFFSTIGGYTDSGPYTNYWFHSAWVELSTNTGTASLSATFDNPVDWAGGQGEINSNAFWNASANVVQLGLAVGGGNYYDIGAAVTSGTATFHLKSFSAGEVAPPTNLSIIPP